MFLWELWCLRIDCALNLPIDESHAFVLRFAYYIKFANWSIGRFDHAEELQHSRDLLVREDRRKDLETGCFLENTWKWRDEK